MNHIVISYFSLHTSYYCKFGLKPDVVEGHFPPQPKGWGY